ncbi:MAG: 50S ribosomal protein L6 [bacterium]
MSRMGNRPLEIPDGVEVKKEDGQIIASGPQGELSCEIKGEIIVEVNEDNVVLDRPTDRKYHKSMHGLMWSLVNNLITGVHEGFEKTLVLNGLGYRVNKSGSQLTLELGFSNPVEIEIPEEVEVNVPNNTTIKVSGADNEAVGQFAATLRQLRDPDPYNQKGIKYQDEYIRQKVGKAVGGEAAMGA